MDKEFYIRKIQQLTKDKLIELIQLRTKDNMEVISLAEIEATKRGIDLKTIEPKTNKPETNTKSKADKEFSWSDFLANIISEPWLGGRKYWLQQSVYASLGISCPHSFRFLY